MSQVVCIKPPVRSMALQPANPRGKRRWVEHEHMRRNRLGCAALDPAAIKEAVVDECKIIQNMPPGTIGIEAVGKVTEDDYREVLLPAVRDALERNDLRLLYVLGKEFRFILSWRLVGRHQTVRTTSEGVEESGDSFGCGLAGEQRQGLRLAHAR
jgi:hypothetical protein